MTCQEVSDTIILQPQKRLDAEGGIALQQQIASLLPEHYKIWVIDLSCVDFINSSGLVALVSGLSTARSHGRRLVLCHLQAPVQLIFEITQLDQVFEIVDTYDEALLLAEQGITDSGLVAA